MGILLCNLIEWYFCMYEGDLMRIVDIHNRNYNWIPNRMGGWNSQGALERGVQNILSGAIMDGVKFWANSEENFPKINKQGATY